MNTAQKVSLALGLLGLGWLVYEATKAPVANAQSNQIPPPPPPPPPQPAPGTVVTTLMHGSTYRSNLTDQNNPDLAAVMNAINIDPGGTTVTWVYFGPDGMPVPPGVSVIQVAA